MNPSGITLIEQLAAKLDGLKFDHIVGIPRGGLVVAAGLGWALGVAQVSALGFRYARIPGRPPAVGKLLCEPVDCMGERVLLVEDATATGTLLSVARRYLEERYAADVTTAALFVSTLHDYRPDEWVEEVDVPPPGRALLAGPVDAQRRSEATPQNALDLSRVDPYDTNKGGVTDAEEWRTDG